MSDDEPGETMVEALRRANPVTPAGSVSRRSFASADALFADVVARRSRRVPHRVLLIALVIVLVALMVMAFVAVRRQRASVEVGSECYAADSLDARRVVAPPADPERSCAELWAAGDLGRGAVPDFDVCTLPAGLLAVFPGESGSVCSRLDLPEYAGDNSIDRFAHSVNGQVSSACIGLRPAEQIVTREIAHRHLSGWTFKRRPGGFDTQRPCASIAVDPAAHTVFIVATFDPFVPPPSKLP